jgi:hypothetical protein
MAALRDVARASHDDMTATKSTNHALSTLAQLRADYDTAEHPSSAAEPGHPGA